jgi:raffinose/stachyose/melibiose transport system permease protein
MNAWNEFFLALIFIRRADLRTIPLGLQAFFFEFQVEWQYLFAALSMATIPVILVYVLMQRQFIAGLTAGATKG